MCLAIMECGQHNRCNILEENWLSHPRSCQICVSPPTPVLELCLTWIYTGILYTVPITVRSYMHLPFCIQKTDFLLPSTISTSSTYLLSLLRKSLRLCGKVVILSSHLMVVHWNFLLSENLAVVDLCIKCHLLKRNFLITFGSWHSLSI